MARFNQGYSGISKRAVAKSVIQCPVCDSKYPVYRTIKKSRSYAPGHIKDLWCYKCKEHRKFVQLDSIEAKYN